MKTLLVVTFLLVGCTAHPAPSAAVPESQLSEAAYAKDVSNRTGFLLAQIAERDRQIAVLKAEKRALVDGALLRDRQPADELQTMSAAVSVATQRANQLEELEARESLRKRQLASALQRIVELSRDIAAVTNERDECNVSRVDALLPLKDPPPRTRSP